jgi:hypothetical protein
LDFVVNDSVIFNKLVFALTQKDSDFYANLPDHWRDITAYAQAFDFYREIRKYVFDAIGGKFEWSAYGPKKCRRVMELDFGKYQKEVDRISSLNHFMNTDQKDLVYINNGSKLTRQKIADTVKQLVSSARPARCKAARRLQDILNSKNTKFYTELVQKNLGATVKLLEKIHRENPDKPNIYQSESSKLRNIWQYPKPIYYPSEKEHTSRLFTVNGGRKVRRCRLKSETPVPQNGLALSLGQVSHDALNTFG